MIWLSPTSDHRECSVYFDIRDIALRQTGNTTEGVVRGVLGDGSCECWSEVSLGGSPLVTILPVWDEAEGLQQFAEAVNITLLKQQLAEAVDKLFTRLQQLSINETIDLQAAQWDEDVPGISLVA